MPGQYYVYIPFSSAEGNEQLVNGAQNWNREMRRFANDMFGDDKTKAKRKTPIILKHGDVKPLLKLSELQPSDYTLYIMAHCNEGKTTVWNINMMVRERVELDAISLVQRMFDDGMPRNIVNMKLYACRGGKAGIVDSQVSKPFAQRLANVLRELGYDKVSLTAYTEPLKADVVTASSDGHKQTEGGARSGTVSVRF